MTHENVVIKEEREGEEREEEEEEEEEEEDTVMCQFLKTSIHRMRLRYHFCLFL